MSGPSTDCPPPPPPSAEPSALPVWNRILGYVCQYLLAAVFLMAAVTKITDLHAFADRTVLHSGLPYALAVTAAAVLPWLELTCGLCLALGVAVREAAVLMALMLAAFLVESLLRPAETDCGCLLFPAALQPANQWPWQPLRNLLLLLCSLRVSWR